MILRIRMLIALMALTVVMGGCDRGWQEFQRIELGKPMPADSILRPEKADDPNALTTTAPSADDQKIVPLVWGDWGTWPVPMSIGWHVVAARADDEGRVISKSYRADVWSNYLLTKVAAIRRVVEVQVPPSVLLELGEAKKDASYVAYVRTEDCRTLRSYISNAMCEVPTAEDDPPDLMECWLLGASHVTRYMLLMSVYQDFEYLDNSIWCLPLNGLTQQGYDRTFRPVCGGSIRLQNLGQGRIRVEMNLLRVYDPLALMGYLYAM